MFRTPAALLRASRHLPWRTMAARSFGLANKCCSRTANACTRKKRIEGGRRGQRGRPRVLGRRTGLRRGVETVTRFCETDLIVLPTLVQRISKLHRIDPCGARGDPQTVAGAPSRQLLGILNAFCSSSHLLDVETALGEWVPSWRCSRGQ